jgi:hypothetical protein
MNNNKKKTQFTFAGNIFLPIKYEYKYSDMPDLPSFNIENLKIDVACSLSNILVFRCGKFSILKGHKLSCTVAATAQP